MTTVYDVQHHDMPQFFSRAERAFRRWAYDDAARTADLVLTTSAWSRERLVELLELEPERVEVVHMGVDLERFTPAPAAIDERLPAELGLPDRFVVYPANLWPHKNHERLVEALARARGRELAPGADRARLRAPRGLMADASSLGVGTACFTSATWSATRCQRCTGSRRRWCSPACTRASGRRRSRPWRAAAPWPPRCGLARRGLRRRRARHRA